MIKLSELILKEGPAEYPADHKPVMRVTKGGSMCANCKWWTAAGHKWSKKYWLTCHDGAEEITYPDAEICSNWLYEK